MAKVRINKERCKGCGYCLVVCPKKNLKTGETMNVRGVFAVVAVGEDNCSGCGMCYIMCPDACIEIESGPDPSPASDPAARESAGSESVRHE